MQFPNSGSLVVALDEFYKRISRFKCMHEQPIPMIAIIADIAYHNPRTYAMCAAIISKLMSFLDSDKMKIEVAKKIISRFSKIPNTGYMQIWLQRITLPIYKNLPYQEPLCKLVSGDNISLWNNAWINNKKLKQAISTPIVDQDAIAALDPVIPINEVELFYSKKVTGYFE
jgi:hypothetical protein